MRSRMKMPYKIALLAFLLGVGAAALWTLKKKLDEKISSNVSSNIDIESKGEVFVERDGVKYRDSNWKELVQLDVESGERGGVLAQIENKMVRIPGYIVPLSDEVAVLDEFLFVPNDQACIHVPPPPPNLIIKAKLKRKLPFEDVYNPSWLMGKLEIIPTKSEFGSSAYQIENAELEKYEE
ncbi:MAG: DUF3299 domain-containing protein [Bdellovibrionota bacterium]